MEECDSKIKNLDIDIKKLRDGYTYFIYYYNLNIIFEIKIRSEVCELK